MNLKINFLLCALNKQPLGFIYGGVQLYAAAASKQPSMILSGGSVVLGHPYNVNTVIVLQELFFFSSSWLGNLEPNLTF